jgi:ParB family transcriptional regulator, chromosome partitioning protein
LRAGDPLHSGRPGACYPRSRRRAGARSYLGPVTKARILDAVREGAGTEAAERIADMKKLDMAEAAEQLLATTGWLPALLRTPEG